MRGTLFALAFLFGYAYANCDVYCETEFVYFKYNTLDGKIELDDDLVDGENVDAAAIVGEKSTVTAFDAIYVDMDDTKDGPKASIGWTEVNYTYCLIWFTDFFHNPRQAFKCQNWRTRFDVKYGTTCGKFDLLGECEDEFREYWLVVNGAESGRSLALATLLAAAAMWVV